MQMKKQYFLVVFPAAMSEFGVEDVIVVHKDSFEKYKFDDVLPYNNKIQFKD